MITTENIKKIIEDCNKAGFSIKVPDIAYILMRNVFEDKFVTFCLMFPTEASEAHFKVYEEQDKVKYLLRYMTTHGYNVSMKSQDSEELSFEENKNEIIKLISETQKALDDGAIEAKDALKIQADLRCKLTDKFKVNDTSVAQYVVVQEHCNHICEFTGHECVLPKEYLMEKFNLVEKSN